ncbi:uncharacterized protein LOC133188823 isoform X2 [Saccostrea echinata]|uniref:uncharacterized protein LOC133188823 isoform X2 n=1 Tax=Saccostrea echinata TaxID=191078 RepID=UPI002A81C804|nr:uncharacterized protein LOC133188823 isoform X2 [Saccostrea echinata]
MKRRLSLEDSCTERDAMAKRRKIRRGKKGRRKHRPHQPIASSQVSPQNEQCASTKNTIHCDSETADKMVTEDFANLQKVCDAGTVSEVPGSEPSAANTLFIDTLSTTDFLGELNDLSSIYTLTELSPKDQPFNVVMDGSSMYLVGLQNHVYLSMVQQPPNSDGQMFCTVEHNTDHLRQHGDNTNCSYYATMDVDRREVHQLKFPSHLLEWSERVKFSHERKWNPLEYLEPNYSKFSF